MPVTQPQPAETDNPIAAAMAELDHQLRELRARQASSSSDLSLEDKHDELAAFVSSTLGPLLRNTLHWVAQAYDDMVELSENLAEMAVREDEEAETQFLPADAVLLKEDLEASQVLCDYVISQAADNADGQQLIGQARTLRDRIKERLQFIVEHTLIEEEGEEGDEEEGEEEMPKPIGQA